MPSPLNGYIQLDTFDVQNNGVNYIDSLLSGKKWGGLTGSSASLTYSFPWTNASQAYWANNPNYSDVNEPSGGYAVDAVQKAAFKEALSSWSNVAKITFSEVADSQPNVGDIRVAWTNKAMPLDNGENSWGWASYPNNYWASGGDVWLSQPGIGTEPNTYWQKGAYGFQSLIHELGHALGLKHPFEDQPKLPAATDTRLYSVMSYTDDPTTLFVKYQQTVDGWIYTSEQVVPDTPMLYDIAAIQYMYGVNNNYNAGDDVYTFNPAEPFLRTIWDGAGNDTISVSNFSLGCTIDLQAGHFSKVAIHSSPPADVNWDNPPPVSTFDTCFDLAIAYNCTIENATGGSGADALIGNATKNQLRGNSGNDQLDGGANIDTAAYAGSKAQYQFNRMNGTISDTVTNRDGTDTLTGIERLQFSDTMVGLDVGKGENTGEVYRLYLTVLGRNPQADAVGCGFWIDKLDRGILNVEQMVGNFLNSTEFVTRFGGTTNTNESFVNLMYLNLLGRDGHPDSGFTFWLNVLNNHQASHEQVVAGFMESPENISNAAPLISDTPTYQQWAG